MQALTRHKLATRGGGVPIVQGERVVGGLGVTGSGDADLDAAIARQAVAGPTAASTSPPSPV